ncbi:MAG: adaptor protein MecA [Lachnospiraceae bacterium]
MKIEKINDNQIRCTLTREDLAQRALKLSELTYGSDKAKTLFRDMMRQANTQFGFEAEDMPLMIEAIPYQEYLILIITKVEDPEELDTRFSNFSSSPSDKQGILSDIMDSLQKEALQSLDLLTNASSAPSDLIELTEPDAIDDLLEDDTNYTKLFSFSSLTSVISFAKLVHATYSAPNTLYKDSEVNNYVLIVTKGEHTNQEYNRFCNVLTEYAKLLHTVPATESFFEEHFSPIIKDTALQTLASLS